MHAPLPPAKALSSPGAARPARTGSASLALRILVAMSLVALVPLFIMAVQGLHCARQAIVELEHTHLQSILAARKSRLEAWFQEREEDLRQSCFVSCGMAGCSGLASHSAADHFNSIGGDLDRPETPAPLYESVGVYDEEWRRVGGTSGTAHHDADLLNDDMKQRLQGATGIVATASHQHRDGHIGLHMGFPLDGEAGSPREYAVVNVNLEETLGRILEDRTGLGPSGRLYLLSVDGTFLAGAASDVHLIGQTADVPPELLAPDAHRVLTYRDASGVAVLGSAAPIPLFNWVLVAEIPKADALGWLALLGRRAVHTGLATFVVVLAIAAHFSRRLADPMRELAETARRIAGGSHGARVAELDGREAREVGHAFNEMLDALTEAQHRVVQSASLAAIGELSASVVHEMRNPLSSIKLNLQALRHKVQGDNNYEELADIASAQAFRLERMLSELLQFGKPIELRLSDVPFRELADEAVAGLQAMAELKRVDISVIDDLQGGLLQVDREQMRRALENLAKNAIEASPEAAKVSIRAVRPNDSAVFAEIRVRDGGPGIPAAVLSRLFQPFTTTRAQGTGLGLANVKKIIEMHEGTVWAENPSGGGALFVLRVPVTTGEV